MKKCNVCGVLNEDNTEKCEVCGVLFPKPQPTPQAAQNPYYYPPVPQKPETSPADKRALAGFILSLGGLLCFFALPFQIMALCLSIAGRTSRRWKSLSTTGIIFAAMGLCATVFFVVAVCVSGNFTDSAFFQSFYQSMQESLS